jgi:hypothetical protein
VAVFAALARGRSVSLIDAELYLPQEWVKDPRRCAAVRIPTKATSRSDRRRPLVGAKRRAAAHVS